MATAMSLDVLARTELCRTLSRDDVATIHAQLDDVTLGQGERLFVEGESGNALYVVVSGELEVLKRDPSGQVRFLARLVPGQVVGEMSLASGGTTRSATVQASQPSLLSRLSAVRFNERVAAGDLASLRLMAAIAGVLARRLAVVDERLVASLGGTPNGAVREFDEFHRLLQGWSF